ncbi:MAG: hypothetical protein ACI3VB_02915 [Oscillospiraceae bacterium]
MANLNIIVSGGTIDQEEIDAYIERARVQYPEKRLTGIEIFVDGAFVDLTYHWTSVPFERIRRITKY